MGRARAWPAPSTPTGPLSEPALLAPVPGPRQVFAIGLNYAAHAAEAGLDMPEFPPTFTKFPTCLTGPDATVVLPSDCVDWEVELVARRRSPRLPGRPRARRWSHIAGLTVGQDLSERMSRLARRHRSSASASRSPGSARPGPWLVTPDELADPDDLALGCTVNGEEMQKSRTVGPHLRRRALIHLPVDRSRRCCPATSSSPARPRVSAGPAPRRASCAPATSWSRPSRASEPSAPISLPRSTPHERRSEVAYLGVEVADPDRLRRVPHRHRRARPRRAHQ